MLTGKLKQVAKQLLSSKKAQAGGHSPEDIDVPGHTNKPRVPFMYRMKRINPRWRMSDMEEDKRAQEEEARTSALRRRKEALEEKAFELREKEAKERDKELKKNSKGGGGGKASNFASRLKNRFSGAPEGGEGAGIALIALSFFVDVSALSANLSGYPYWFAFDVLFALAIYLGWGFRDVEQDPLIFVFLTLNLMPLVLRSVDNLPGLGFVSAYLVNPFVPFWLIYAGFLRNSRKGIFLKVIFMIFVVLLLAVGWHFQKTQVAEALSDLESQVTPEQVAAAEQAKSNIGFVLKEFFTDVGKGIAEIPKSAISWVNPQISEAGGSELFGEPKERPKLGLVIQEHPRGYTTFEENGVEKAVVKAILLIPNPVEGNFLEVTDVECSADNGKTVVKPFEFSKDGATFDGPVKVFYNSPTTVSCIFGKEDVGKLSGVKLSVKYKFDENAKLITYLMRADLLEEIKISGENPLDFMAVPSGRRRPSTVYDNGPAKIGIGPQELLQPPVGVPTERTQFELIIGNMPDFNGRISGIDAVSVVLPKGVNLADNCFLAKSGESAYALSSSFINDNKKALANIKTSRLFICGMEITGAALSDASFAEVEFDVNLKFTYEAEKTLRLKE